MQATAVPPICSGQRVVQTALRRMQLSSRLKREMRRALWSRCVPPLPMIAARMVWDVCRYSSTVRGTGDLLPRPDLALNTWLGIWDGRSASGPHIIGVRVTDRAGNTRDTTVNVTVGTTP